MRSRTDDLWWRVAGSAIGASCYQRTRAAPPSIDCECSPPGWEIPDNALLTVFASSSVHAMSPSETMPTRRLSWLTTGRRRTLMSAIFNATSSTSSSSKQYFTSALITSRTLVSADLPAATARMAMSRSVIIPTSRSFSPTGSDPQSSFAIRHAASRIDWSGLVTWTSLLITWLTCMEFLLPVEASFGYALPRCPTSQVRRGPALGARLGCRCCHIGRPLAGNACRGLLDLIRRGNEGKRRTLPNVPGRFFFTSPKDLRGG